MSQKAHDTGDRGQIFDEVKIGRPATGALVDACYRSSSDLPEDLAELSDLHGVGPRAVALLQAAALEAALSWIEQSQRTWS